MADKKVQIKIDTTANTKGAKDASAALDKVNESQKDVARSADAADDTIAGMRSEITRLTTELENTNVSSQEFVQKATQLDAAQKRLNGALNTSGAGFKNVGSLIGQAGFQIQDFAVQVGAGTSALTAFSQQGSQLLGAFGPGGAVAGALLAIGAIAAKVFLPAEVEMGRFLTNIEEVAKLAAQGVAENFDAVIEGIQRSATEAANLASQYDGVAEAGDRFADSELENAEKRRQTLITINQLLGVQRDTLIELRQQQDAEASKRALDTQQAINAQNAIAQRAQDSVERNNQDRLNQSELLASLRTELELQTRKLETFRQQRAELEAQQRNAPSFLENVSSAVFPNTSIAERRINADSANSILGAGGPELQVTTAEARVAELASRVKELTQSLETSAQALVAENERASVVAANVETEIARIQEVSRTDELVASVTNAKETLEAGQQQVLTGLQSLVTASQPVTESQKQARDLVAAALEGGQITAQEAASIAQQLPILLRTISGTNQVVLTNFGIIENDLKIYQTQLRDMERRLNEVSRQLGKPTN